MEKLHENFDDPEKEYDQMITSSFAVDENAQEYIDLEELHENFDDEIVPGQEKNDQMIIEDIFHEQPTSSLALLDTLFARITQLEKDLQKEKNNSKRRAIKNNFLMKEMNDLKRGLKKIFC